ncbi:MAG: flavin reductase family protein [Saccharothrix sp.]|nr:flavin reductase family protein [Saccharothrix sp.]
MTDPMAQPDLADGFRAMMRGFPTGVAVVTATDADGRPWGMTCSSLCAVTLDPPMLLVCLRAASPTLAAVLRHGAFAVNLLDDGAGPVAELFASAAPDRFDRVSWRRDRGAAGPHLHHDTHAVADCRTTATVPAGGHVVVLGEVTRITRADRTPLVYADRGYRRWPVPLPAPSVTSAAGGWSGSRPDAAR